MHNIAELNTPAELDTSKECRLVELLDRCLADMQAGHGFDRDAILAANPDLADELAEYLDSLQFISAFRGTDEPVAPDIVESLRTLGDYRLIREVGRGGMGVVYEAEQLSLGRRVALKVLPFAAVLDPRQLQRFKNEALAAASLDHPNIVEVHAVGCERGVHFYAMRFVEGQTLTEVIEGMRNDECGMRNDPVGNGLRAVPTLQEDDAVPIGAPGTPQRAFPTDPDTLAAALSTLRTTRPRDYYRAIAELGIQAAEALDHAHQMGIVHRDIKPSNLMIEVRNSEFGMRSDQNSALRTPHSELPFNSALRTPNSKLFITDFGLAQIETSASLTVTGDLLGTGSRILSKLTRTTPNQLNRRWATVPCPLSPAPSF